MSNYPAWWDATVTVYSKRVDIATSIVSWHKVTIPNCFWKRVGSKVTVGDIQIDTESVTCRIPQNANFVEPFNWIDMPEAELNGKFTLQQGDIIIKGDCNFEVNEYKAGHRSTDLVAKYRKIQGCIEVKDVAINTMTGMMNPHYNVRGL